MTADREAAIRETVGWPRVQASLYPVSGQHFASKADALEWLLAELDAAREEIQRLNHDAAAWEKAELESRRREAKLRDALRSAEAMCARGPACGAVIRAALADGEGET